MTTPAIESDRTTLAAALERYVTHLRDRAQADALAGRQGAATVRQLVVRELGELILQHLDGVL